MSARVKLLPTRWPVLATTRSSTAKCCSIFGNAASIAARLGPPSGVPGKKCAPRYWRTSNGSICVLTSEIHSSVRAPSTGSRGASGTVESVVDVEADSARLAERHIAVPHDRDLAEGVDGVDPRRVRARGDEGVLHPLFEAGDAENADIIALR